MGERDFKPLTVDEWKAMLLLWALMLCLTVPFGAAGPLIAIFAYHGLHWWMDRSRR